MNNCGCVVADGGRDTKPNIFPTDAFISLKDRLCHWGFRWGIGRMSARVVPGLYAVGDPDKNSPVLVSSNYKMSFDILRSSLANQIFLWCSNAHLPADTEALP